MVVHLLNRLTFPINLLASGLNASDADVLQVAGPTETLTWTWSVPLDVRSSLHVMVARGLRNRQLLYTLLPACGWHPID